MNKRSNNLLDYDPTTEGMKVLCFACKQIAWDDARRLAKRRLEREQGRNDAVDDLSELSEGEKEKWDSNNISESIKDISRINSDTQICFDDDKSKHLYIVLIRYSNKPKLYITTIFIAVYYLFVHGPAAYMGWSAEKTWNSEGILIRVGRYVLQIKWL